MKMLVSFNLINVSPGKYSVKAMMIGYENCECRGRSGLVNRTTSLDIKMKQSIVEGQRWSFMQVSLVGKKIKQAP